MYQTAHTGETRVTTPYHYLHSCNMAKSSLHQWLCKRQGTITPRTLMYRNRNLLAKMREKTPHTHSSQSSLLSDTRSLSVVSGRAIPNEADLKRLHPRIPQDMVPAFQDLLYLKPPEHKDSKKDVKGGRSAYRLNDRALKEARSMVPQVQDIGNSRSLGVVCCHASSACSGEELVMHVYIDLDAAFLFSPLCPSSLSMAVVPKSMRVSWMGCNDEMEHTNSRRKEWLFA